MLGAVIPPRKKIGVSWMVSASPPSIGARR
jgi:hypothetical protein